jgi:hypothetical protein
MARIAPLLVLISFGLSCGGAQVEPTSTALSFDQLERERFNQLALMLDAPVFWAADSNENGSIDPDEIRTLLFYGSTGHWTDERGHFTPDFEDAYRQMVALEQAGEPRDARLALIHEELSSVAVSLVETDLRALPADDQEFARRMLSVARTVDQLYARQVGVAALSRQHRAPDAASRAVLRRNWGPGCLSSSLEGNEACTALPGSPKQRVDVYPAALQTEDGFCERLHEREDAETLLSPFSAVRERDGALVAVPYPEAYPDEMRAIAAELRVAANALHGPTEEPLRRYLRAAAQSFENNDWFPADDAWSRMNAESSRWYVRVGPDEVYWDPCSRKAGFHMTFALIDRASLEWQARLSPLQQDMETSIAALSEAYDARDVSFHLPDFIQIVVNAGDDRDPFGATIGQSLPNWGPVAEENRGRTVAMTNLYTDADNAARRRTAAESILTNDAMTPFTPSPNPGLMSTILHEATHNLGPAHEYRVDGRTSDEIFGGEMASMLEELKAQSGALFLLSLLRERDVLDETAVREAYLDSIIWAFGHISRGMYTPDGHRKAYSQLAAIQIGELLASGALTWNATRDAANGQDQGAFDIDYAAMPAAAEALMQKVVHMLASGDAPAANALAAQHVDGDTVPKTVIAERHARFPRASFVYAVTF